MQTRTISELKQQGAALFAGLKNSNAPLLLTRGGKPEAYLMSVDAFDALSNARKRMKRWLS
jgi:PHD/YefM family antitoxin component YafN of YafNO toxin-antitoxin module